MSQGFPNPPPGRKRTRPSDCAEGLPGPPWRAGFSSLLYESPRAWPGSGMARSPEARQGRVTLEPFFACGTWTTQGLQPCDVLPMPCSTSRSGLAACPGHALDDSTWSHPGVPRSLPLLSREGCAGSDEPGRGRGGMLRPTAARTPWMARLALYRGVNRCQAGSCSWVAWVILVPPRGRRVAEGGSRSSPDRPNRPNPLDVASSLDAATPGAYPPGLATHGHPWTPMPPMDTHGPPACQAP